MDLGLVGAITGVTALALRLHDRHRLKPRLRVTVNLCDRQGFSAYHRPGQHHLAIEALNTGLVPVVIRDFGHSLGSGPADQWYSAGPDDPVVLEPGHSLRQVVPLWSRAIEDTSLLSSIWARDTLERRYPVSRWKVREIQDQLEFSAFRAEMRDRGLIVV